MICSCLRVKNQPLSKAAFFFVVFETNGARVVFAVLGRAWGGCGRRVYAGRVRVYAGLVRVEAGVGVGGCGCAVRGGVCGCAVAGVGGSCGRVWVGVGGCGWMWAIVRGRARVCVGLCGGCGTPSGAFRDVPRQGVSFQRTPSQAHDI
jgi:hypothetical protein